MSVVEFIYEPGGPRPSNCGYCKSRDTNFTEGVWAHRMTCEDFQDLVDRGFQRSGKYVYRPVNNRVCCPQYIIRMDAMKFRPNKSQRKVVKRLHRYLREGKGSLDAVAAESDMNTGKSSLDAVAAESDMNTGKSSLDAVAAESDMNTGKGSSDAVAAESDMNTNVSPKKSRLSSPDHEKQESQTTKKQPNPGKGADPMKPKCRKAKDIRREKRLLKMAQTKESDAKSVPPSVMDVGTPVDKPVGTPVDRPEEEGGKDSNGQDLLDLVTLPDPKDCVHKLEIKLVKSWPRSPEVTATFASSYAVFKKFQSIVHLDDHDCDERHYSDFIVESPLVREPAGSQNKPGGTGGPTCDYGSYHQQYWLDGNLVAVALLDILPRMIVCEYFFYDPSYKFLSLGVYSAVREIAFVRELGRQDPRMRHYCMGYYVHSCPKMAYKNQYGSAELLCATTLQYVPIERCLPKLEVTKYCKLGEGEAAEEEPLDLDALTVYHEMQAMPYREYRTKYGDRTMDMLRQYGTVMGSKVGRRMRVNLTFF